MTDLDALTNYIAYTVPEAAQMEQAAEEAVELAHALLKLARITRGESPTPADLYRAMDNVSEQVNDVLSTLSVLAVRHSFVKERKRIRLIKMRRWAERMANNECK